jgi:CRISPR/Cas system CMR-associated protein Cmr5 small subunit
MSVSTMEKRQIKPSTPNKEGADLASQFSQEVKNRSKELPAQWSEFAQQVPATIPYRVDIAKYGVDKTIAEIKSLIESTKDKQDKKNFFGNMMDGMGQKLKRVGFDWKNGLMNDDIRERFGHAGSLDVKKKKTKSVSEIYDNSVQYILSSIEPELNKLSNKERQEVQRKIDQLISNFKQNTVSYLTEVKAASARSLRESNQKIDSESLVDNTKNVIKDIKPNYNATKVEQKGLIGKKLSRYVANAVIGVGTAVTGGAGTLLAAGATGVLRGSIGAGFAESKKYRKKLDELKRSKVENISSQFDLVNLNSFLENTREISREEFNKLDAFISKQVGESLHLMSPEIRERFDQLQDNLLRLELDGKISNEVENKTIISEFLGGSQKSVKSLSSIESDQYIELQAKTEAKKGRAGRVLGAIGFSMLAVGAGFGAREYLPDLFSDSDFVGGLKRAVSSDTYKLDGEGFIAVSSHNTQAIAELGNIDQNPQQVGDLLVFAEDGGDVDLNDVLDTITEDAIKLGKDFNIADLEDVSINNQTIPGIKSVAADRDVLSQNGIKIGNVGVYEGNSGRGLIDSEGNLLGTVVGKFKDTGDLAIATDEADADAINGLIQDGEIEPYANDQLKDGIDTISENTASAEDFNNINHVSTNVKVTNPSDINGIEIPDGENLTINGHSLNGEIKLKFLEALENNQNGEVVPSLSYKEVQEILNSERDGFDLKTNLYGRGTTLELQASRNEVWSLFESVEEGEYLKFNENGDLIKVDAENVNWMILGGTIEDDTVSATDFPEDFTLEESNQEVDTELNQDAENTTQETTTVEIDTKTNPSIEEFIKNNPEGAIRANEIKDIFNTEGLNSDLQEFLSGNESNLIRYEVDENSIVRFTAIEEIKVDTGELINTPETYEIIKEASDQNTTGNAEGLQIILETKLRDTQLKDEVSTEIKSFIDRIEVLQQENYQQGSDLKVSFGTGQGEVDLTIQVNRGFIEYKLDDIQENLPETTINDENLEQVETVEDLVNNYAEETGSLEERVNEASSQPNNIIENIETQIQFDRVSNTLFAEHGIDLKDGLHLQENLKLAELVYNNDPNAISMMKYITDVTATNTNISADDPNYIFYSNLKEFLETSDYQEIDSESLQAFFEDPRYNSDLEDYISAANLEAQAAVPNTENIPDQNQAVDSNPDLEEIQDSNAQANIDSSNSHVNQEVNITEANDLYESNLQNDLDLSLKLEEYLAESKDGVLKIEDVEDLLESDYNLPDDIESLLQSSLDNGAPVQIAEGENGYLEFIPSQSSSISSQYLPESTKRLLMENLNSDNFLEASIKQLQERQNLASYWRYLNQSSQADTSPQIAADDTGNIISFTNGSERFTLNINNLSQDDRDLFNSLNTPFQQSEEPISSTLLSAQRNMLASFNFLERSNSQDLIDQLTAISDSPYEHSIGHGQGEFTLNAYFPDTDNTEVIPDSDTLQERLGNYLQSKPDQNITVINGDGNNVENASVNVTGDNNITNGNGDNYINQAPEGIDTQAEIDTGDGEDVVDSNRQELTSNQPDNASDIPPSNSQGPDGDDNLRDLAGIEDQGPDSGWGGNARFDQAKEVLIEMGIENPTPTDLSRQFLIEQFQAGSGGMVDLDPQQAEQVLNSLLNSYNQSSGSNLSLDEFSLQFIDGNIPRSESLSNTLLQQLNSISPNTPGFNQLTSEAISSEGVSWVNNPAEMQRIGNLALEDAVASGQITPEAAGELSQQLEEDEALQNNIFTGLKDILANIGNSGAGSTNNIFSAFNRNNLLFGSIAGMLLGGSVGGLTAWGAKRNVGRGVARGAVFGFAGGGIALPVTQALALGSGVSVGITAGTATTAGFLGGLTAKRRSATSTETPPVTPEPTPPVTPEPTPPVTPEPTPPVTPEPTPPVTPEPTPPVTPEPTPPVTPEPTPPVTPEPTPPVTPEPTPPVTETETISLENEINAFNTDRIGVLDKWIDNYDTYQFEYIAETQDSINVDRSVDSSTPHSFDYLSSSTATGSNFLPSILLGTDRYVFLPRISANQSIFESEVLFFDFKDSSNNLLDIETADNYHNKYENFEIIKPAIFNDDGTITEKGVIRPIPKSIL